MQLSPPDQSPHSQHASSTHMGSIHTGSTHTESTYIGRFAPSPSGPLHFGSLITALASFLDAKHHNGTWLVRMEDIDPPREQLGAKAWILKSLEAHGLHWDQRVMYQSSRLSAYDEALASLKNATYLCTCSRPRLLSLNSIYDSHCLQHPVDNKPVDNHSAQVMTSTRVRLDCLDTKELSKSEGFNDLIQGKQQQSLHNEVGDFILRRKDGLVAYQLAVVVDDIEQQITHIIRGSDLLSSTPRQRYLTLLLQKEMSRRSVNDPATQGDLELPIYGHIPVATNALGQKLSKQHKSTGINDDTAFSNLCDALTFLRHPAPDDIAKEGNIEHLLTWAIQHWDRQKLPQTLSITVGTVENN